MVSSPAGAWTRTHRFDARRHDRAVAGALPYADRTGGCSPD